MKPKKTGLSLAAGATVALLSACSTIPKGLLLTPHDDDVAGGVAEVAARTPARLGIVALHVESGRRLSWNETESFEAASVVKIALLAEAAAEWREARFDPNDRWKMAKGAVAAGSGILVEFEPGLMPTNRDLLRIMITLSDNTATNSFIDRFGASAVNRRMEALGLPGLRLVGRIPDADKEPERWGPLGRITPKDTAEYFRRLFAGTLIDTEADFFMREIYRTQRTKNRIPRLLLDAKENVWAGKTGSMNAVRNDAGVLTTKKGRFVLVVLADGIPDDDRDGPAVTRAIGEIAKAIVDGWSATLPDVSIPPDMKPPPSLLAVPNSWWEGYGASKIDPVTVLVLHHTSQATDEECVSLFLKPESQVSSHFLVGHEHVAPDRKNDPGALFPWNDVLRKGLASAAALSSGAAALP